MKSSVLIGALVGMLSLAGAAVAETPQLETVQAQIRQLPREFRLDGVVEAVNRTTVSAQTSGQVQELRFDVDEFVEKGAVIVVLKDTEHQARVMQAAADLKDAVARLEEAREEHKRTREVFAKKLVSASAMDKAEADIKSASARSEASQAALAQAREQFDYTRIRAPFSGIVTQRHVEIGEVAQPGQPLVTGITLDQLRVLVDVPQSLIPRIREFGKARVQRPDGGSLQAVKLTVFPIADRGSNTFRVRVDLPEGTSELFPGMFVKTSFVTGLKQELVIPAASVVYRSEVTGVYVVDPQGRIGFRHVRVGRETDDGSVLILAGVVPGEQVALDPTAAGVALKRQRAESGDG